MTRPASKARAAICTARCPTSPPTARDIDRVTGLDGPVKASESGQEAHRKRRGVAEARGWRLADGEELARHGIAAFAFAPPTRDPAAIAVQIGHRGHSVADSHAAHIMARGDDDAGKVEAKNDGGRSPHEIKVGQLVFEWVERRGGNADQHLVGRRLRDGNTHRLERESGSVPRVADSQKRLRTRLWLCHVLLPADGAPGRDRVRRTGAPWG